MLCKHCDSTVPEDSLFCPVCGFRLKVEASLQPVSVGRARTAERGGSPGILWFVVLSLLTSALLSAIIGLGLVGMRQGLEERQRRNRETGLEFYRRGLEHLEESNYHLALAEFEEALRLAPDCAEAHEQLAVVRALIDQQAMPTSVAREEAVVMLHEQARALYADGQWEQVILKLQQLRRLDSGYQRQSVETMLFDAFYQQAVSLMEAGELEEALAHLDSALEIRSDGENVSELRLCLSLYLVGLTQWGVDWERAVETFEELYGLKPDFIDVRQRLHDAYMSLGGLYSEEGAWCLAEHQYGKASQIMASQAAASKRDEAREACVEAVSAATPSVVPTAVLTPSLALTTTVVSSSPAQVCVGEFTGYVEADETEMRIGVRVMNSDGEGMPGVEVEISGYDWRDTETTDAEGYCGFCGLSDETYVTVALKHLACAPVQIHCRWGTEARVDFVTE